MGQQHSRSDASLSVASTTAMQKSFRRRRSSKQRFSRQSQTSYVELGEDWESCGQSSIASSRLSDASGFVSLPPTLSSSQMQQRHRRRVSFSSSLQKEESTNTLACSEASSTAHSSSSTLPSQQPDEEEDGPPTIQEFYLKKRRPNTHKHGLHWQEDPRPNGVWLHHGWHWPRDYATIRGQVISHKGKKWLLAKQVRQFGSDTWHKAPKGAALPMFYGNLYVLVSRQQYQATQDEGLRARMKRMHELKEAKQQESQQDVSYTEEESKVSLDDEDDDDVFVDAMAPPPSNDELLNMGEITAI